MNSAINSSRGAVAVGANRSGRLASFGLLSLLGPLALLGCAGSPAAEPPPHAVREVVELAVWKITAGGAALGIVRHLEIRDPAGPLRFYRIEDRDGRWLGHATPEGRFARRVPFAEQEEDLGVWPLARGVGMLVGADAVVLEPIVAAPPR
ncbi:MAG: hypothetical protein RL398_2082 [Planctomycetota bacterium]